MNIVMLSGYATKLPELTKTKNGVSRTKLTIAVKDNRGNHTDFVDCIAWNQLAERISNHVIKGTYVEVRGHIKVRDFKGQKNNGNGYIYIVADNVRFVYTPEDSRRRHEQEKRKQQAKQQSPSTHQQHDVEQQARPVVKKQQPKQQSYSTRQQQAEQRQERPVPQQRVEQHQERPAPQQRVEQHQERPVIEKQTPPKKPKNRVIMKKEPEVKKVTQSNQRTFEVDFSDVSEDDLPF